MSIIKSYIIKILSKFKIIFLTLIFGSINLYSWVDRKLNISEKLYSEIKYVGLNLAKECPPAQCVVIAIGRSPTPIISFLSYLYDNYIYNIPLTDFSYDPDGFAAEKLNAELEDKLFGHFKRYLPDFSNLENKDIVVLDYASEGDTIFSATKYLTKYFSSLNHKMNIIPYVISASYNFFRTIEKYNMPRIKEHLRVYSEVLDINENNLIQLMRFSEFKDIGPYGKYLIRFDSDPPEILLTKEFIKFRSEMAAIMDFDNSLKLELSKKENKCAKIMLVIP